MREVEVRKGRIKICISIGNDSILSIRCLIDGFGGKRYINSHAVRWRSHTSPSREWSPPTGAALILT